MLCLTLEQLLFVSPPPPLPPPPPTQGYKPVLLSYNLLLISSPVFYELNSYTGTYNKESKSDRFQCAYIEACVWNVSQSEDMSQVPMISVCVRSAR